MKRNRVVLMFAAGFLMLAIAGCGGRGEDSAKGSGTEAVIDQTGAAGDSDAEEHTSQLQLGSAVEIPESFQGQSAETDAHGQLEKVIAQYCNVAEEDYAKVRYYYNYVDLNEDGKNEILALVLGEDVNGIDGNALLWVDAKKSGEMTTDDVRQSFRQVGVPVYISSGVTNGYRDLIFTNDENPVGRVEDESGQVENEEVTANNAGRTADGEETALENTAGLDDTTGENGATMVSLDQTYLILTWKGEKYQTLEEGTVLFNLEGYEGTAILTNNRESGSGNANEHVLGEAM